MLGSGTLWTRPITLWIFWSEILTCSSGSSPDTLNLGTKDNSLTEQAVSQSTCGRGEGRGWGGVPWHPGVIVHHALGQLDGKVHGPQDVLRRGILLTGRLPVFTCAHSCTVDTGPSVCVYACACGCGCLCVRVPDLL